jgi:type II secretory ATPase GspE/PulE/Tfp pilus assembly ATPase PilB-like protein
MEKVYSRTVDVEPSSDLVEQPKGDPPNVAEVFRNMSSSSTGAGLGGGHVCIVGPTGSGKSTIVRGILCALTAQNTLAIYSMEYPVEVNLNTHGLFHVCQIDMFQEIQGKQRTLANTANSLLRHDPDMIYFGELRNKIDFETATSIALSGVAVISTGHASSPIDLLERLRSMNIDLKTQFRAFKCIMGVKRVPILCPHCKRQMVMYGRTQNRALQLFNLYRIVSTEKHNRRQVMPIVCMPPENKQDDQNSGEKAKSCPHCVNGYIRNHTIYEYLYITPESDMEKLRETHTYTTEETLISLIMEGSVNPLYLQNSL